MLSSFNVPMFSADLINVNIQYFMDSQKTVHEYFIISINLMK